MDDELLSVPVPLGNAEPPSALDHDHDDDLSKKLRACPPSSFNVSTWMRR